MCVFAHMCVCVCVCEQNEAHSNSCLDSIDWANESNNIVRLFALGRGSGFHFFINDDQF